MKNLLALSAIIISLNPAAKDMDQHEWYVGYFK